MRNHDTEQLQEGIEQGRKLYIDAGKDLKIHKISNRVTLQLLKKIDLEMLPHLKNKFRKSVRAIVFNPTCASILYIQVSYCNFT